MRYNLDGKWSVVGQGFVNVFGESDGWELMGGVAYRISQGWTGTFGYRFLHEEFSPSRLNLNTDISGFILGATYRF
jgi:opacity protein-like surface antigen